MTMLGMVPDRSGEIARCRNRLKMLGIARGRMAKRLFNLELQVKREYKYADLCIRYERTAQQLYLLENDIEQPDYEIKEIKQEPEETRMPTVLTRLDRLPDLCIQNVAGYLETIIDIRALFIVLWEPERIFYTFFNQIRAVTHANGQMPNHLYLCEAPPFCRQPILCIRCYLCGKSKCMECKTPVRLPFGEWHSGVGCDTLYTFGDKQCSCKFIRKCPRCSAPYHPDDESTFLREQDWHCPCCRDTKLIGCIKCTQECTQCANIGCKKTQHYQVKDLVISGGSLWDKCTDCGISHCCARKTLTSDQITYGIEWDTFACPQLERIAEPPQQKKRGREVTPTSTTPRPKQKLKKCSSSKLCVIC